MSSAITVFPYGIGDYGITSFADSYQVILYTLLSEALIAFGAVVYLQSVARAVLVAQPALVVVQGEPGLALGFPGGGLHIGFITGAIHKSSLPCLAQPIPSQPFLNLPNRAGPHHTEPRPAEPCRTAPNRIVPNLAAPRLAPPYPALQLVARWRAVVPCHARPSPAVPNRTVASRILPGLAVPHRVLPRRVSSCPEKEISLPTCLVVALAEGRTRVWADRQANACNRNRKSGFTSFSTDSISHPRTFV